MTPPGRSSHSAGFRELLREIFDPIQGVLAADGNTRHLYAVFPYLSFFNLRTQGSLVLSLGHFF